MKYVNGNIFDSQAEAIVNTVNTVGVMGKGIALQFKRIFPHNYKTYKEACANGDIAIGKLLLTKESSLHTGEKIIINFPTKKHWRNPSQYSYIEKGLEDLIRIIEENQINSIAIPPLGAGNGGLDWEKVKEIIEDKLKQVDIDIYIYEPGYETKEALKQEKVKLTPARALLLYVLYDLVADGEYVSEFSSEKVAYFLQRHGAENIFNLDYKQYYYGPYSGKVRHILAVLNGSYITGYSDKDKKPFDPLFLIADGYKNVIEYIDSRLELKEIAQRTMRFLRGFYSDIGLELLSTLDYIAQKEQSLEKDILIREMNSWSNRKSNLIENSRHLDISIQHIQQAEMVFY